MGNLIVRLLELNTLLVPFSLGKRLGLTDGPIYLSGPSDVCSNAICCASIGGKGEEGAQSELELESGVSDLRRTMWY